MQVICGMAGFLLCHEQGREWRARARFFAGEYTNRNSDTADTCNALTGIKCRCKLRVESGRLYIRERPAVGRASGRAAFQTLSQAREGALSPQRLLKGEKAHRNDDTVDTTTRLCLLQNTLPNFTICYPCVTQNRNRDSTISAKSLLLLVGATRFELATTRPPV